MISQIKQALNKRALKDPKYSYLFDSPPEAEVVVLDTETTGLDPKRDEILSIGAVIVKGEKILINSAFERFVKPTSSISAQSIKIHHIRDCDLANGIDVDTAIEELLEFIGSRPIVGYYIDFDHKILSRYTKRLIGSYLPNSKIELSSMYYKRYRKESSYEFVDLKFDTIMTKLNLPTLGKHDALNDAIMSALIYLKLKDMPVYKGAFS